MLAASEAIRVARCALKRNYTRQVPADDVRFEAVRRVGTHWHVRLGFRLPMAQRDRPRWLSKVFEIDVETGKVRS